MYIRTTRRKNKDGSVVEYVQLAHNHRDADTGRPKPTILFNFGRRDGLDEDALLRLVGSIERFLGPKEELAGGAVRSGSSPFLESQPMGGGWILRGVWDQLKLGETLARFATAQGAGDPAGFAGCVWTMVANRALDPLSKHATVAWLEGDVHLAQAPKGIYDERLYRAMDVLLEAGDELQKTVFHACADLLNLEVDLLLYDTTSIYTEMEDNDIERQERAARWAVHDAGQGEAPSRPRPQVVNEPPMRLKGHSKDHRPDLAQIVVGLAVTREGIPVRCWVWPGNKNDATTVAEVKRSLAGWRLNRVIWAVDRGMTSEENLRVLQEAGAHFIAGEKMRAGKADVEEALSRPGRFRRVADNLEVKEVIVDADSEMRKRFVVIRNLQQAERDRQVREATLAKVREALAGLPEEGGSHTKAACRLVAHRSHGRYVKTDRRGRLVLDRAKVKTEQRLDGKYLVVTSDLSLPTDDVALGYKQLAEVERAWRTLKTHLDVQPMYHRKADRIRAHVMLCWLALLLVRVLELRCSDTWPRIRQDMDRLHRGVFEGPDGRFVQRTELTVRQLQLLKATGVAPPPRFETIEPVTTASLS